jgi:hypothetical protein
MLKDWTQPSARTWASVHMPEREISLSYALSEREDKAMWLLGCG